MSFHTFALAYVQLFDACDFCTKKVCGSHLMKKVKGSSPSYNFTWQGLIPATKSFFYFFFFTPQLAFPFCTWLSDLKWNFVSSALNV